MIKNGDVLYLDREFSIIYGEVIAASNFAKWKTRLQVIAISSILFLNFPFQFISFPFDIITLWIAMILTILSGWDSAADYIDCKGGKIVIPQEVRLYMAKK